MAILSWVVGLVVLVGTAGVDQALVRREMEEVIASLDLGAYEKSVDVPEQIVLAYEWAQGRAPDPVEFHTLLGMWAELNLKPSDLLSFAIRGNEPAITWEMCAEFVARKTARPQPCARTKALAAALLNTPPEKDGGVSPAKSSVGRAAVKSEPGVAYNTYFGYFHAHSKLSDGEGSPDEAYAAARDAGLDFFALTDHGELLLIWPWEDKWEQERSAADRADAPGEYAALWGFEWSSPLYGHVTVVNSEDYTDCLSTFCLVHLYDWLADRPDAFAEFNHPGCFDYAIADLLHFRLFDQAVNQMVGVECWNGDDGFDRYYYGGNWDGPESYLDRANLNGWRVGALGGEDNHRADWGRMGRFRTGVLATELTREAIAEAYMSRRFYATEDDNLCLDFRCGGYPMGSMLDDEARVFEVRASDRDGEAFEEVRLYRNGQLVESRPVTGGDVVEVFEDGSTENAYYYVILKQADDSDANGRNDEAISSPIWFGDLDGAKSGCYSPLFKEQQASAGWSDLAVLLLAAGALMKTNRTYKKRME
ncbi:MAG TPA: CehA/McbA family metallohydrolase [Candidatus Bathyarchaeia archaeon]|nr:CehA/McbA family metallohydrolase [Candidatus Bathyarchaeia archaeon]